MRQPTTLAGLFIVAALVLTAALAPTLAPHPPFEQDLSGGLARPGRAHWLGQDHLGRDILSRLIYGSRISLAVGVITVGVSALLGVFLGALAGYWGGWTDEVIMRFTDILLAFPGLLLAIALMAVRGPGLSNVILALSVLGWVGYARLIRGQILALKEREFVTAARALGAPSRRIIGRHLLPNVLSPLLVEATFGMAGAILAEAGLSFLGLGTQPPNPSWGTMLNEGRRFLLEAPHLSLSPGLAIMLVVLAFNFLGDGLRDALDPTLRSR